MNYHISTTIIFDNFKKRGECPLCDVYREVEQRVIEQFMGEAVMLDDFRDRVNKKGFCEKHFKMLAAGENKLGAALQAHTRLEYLTKRLAVPRNAKAALRAADDIETALSGCAVCDLIEDSMERYYNAVPRLFACEEGFDGMYSHGKGFCLHHYAELLRHADKAAGRREDFLRITANLEKRNLERLLTELDGFCNKFDYRNADRPLGDAEGSLPRTVDKIHGKR